MAPKLHSHIITSWDAHRGQVRQRLQSPCMSLCIPQMEKTTEKMQRKQSSWGIHFPSFYSRKLLHAEPAHVMCDLICLARLNQPCIYSRTVRKGIDSGWNAETGLLQEDAGRAIKLFNCTIFLIWFAEFTLWDWTLHPHRAPRSW